MIVWSTNSSIQEAEVERSSISKHILKGHKNIKVSHNQNEERKMEYEPPSKTSPQCTKCYIYLFSSNFKGKSCTRNYICKVYLISWLVNNFTLLEEAKLDNI